MAVIRVEKNSNYTTMSNKHLRDKRISLKAKGLLSQMLSLPDDWGYSVGGLASVNQEGEKAIISTLKELKTALGIGGTNRFMTVTYGPTRTHSSDTLIRTSLY